VIATRLFPNTDSRSTPDPAITNPHVPKTRMKAYSIKKLLSLSSLALFLGLAHSALAGGVTGTNGGYYYFTYYTGSGSTSISFPGSGGNFVGSWTSGVTDSLCGKGWNPGSIRNVGYNVGVLSGNWHSVAVYGFAPYPNVEYYITDMGSNSGTFIGTVNSDGGTYNVYKGSQANGPQYKDSRTVAQSKGANHTVTMANHVNYWKAHIGSFATPSWTVLSVEAFGGPGNTNATVW